MEETNKKHSDEPKTEIKPNDIVKPDFIMTLLLSERGIRKEKGRNEEGGQEPKKIYRQSNLL